MSTGREIDSAAFELTSRGSVQPLFDLTLDQLAVKMCIDVKVTLSAKPVANLDNRLALRRKLKGSLDDVVLAHRLSKLLQMH